MLFLYHYSMAHTIIHPLTQSPPPRRTRRNRLQEVQRSCCCFAMTVRTSWMSLFKQDKYYYFSDRSGYRLFKPNGIKSLLFLSTSTHFCLTQLPFTVISVRCAEAELRWHFFFFLKQRQDVFLSMNYASWLSSSLSLPWQMQKHDTYPYFSWLKL